MEVLEHTKFQCADTCQMLLLSHLVQQVTFFFIVLCFQFYVDTHLLYQVLYYLPSCVSFLCDYLPLLCVAPVSNFLPSPIQNVVLPCVPVPILPYYINIQYVQIQSMWNAVCQRFQDVLNHYTFVVICSMQAIRLLWLFYPLHIRRCITYCMSLCVVRISTKLREHKQ